MKGSIGSTGGMHTYRPDRQRDRFPIKFYNRYIHSEKWLLKREEAFEKFGRKCRKCGALDHLEVHHKTYVRLGDELLKDLEILCKHCHKKLHKKQRNRRAERRETYRHPKQEITLTTYYPDRRAVRVDIL